MTDRDWNLYRKLDEAYTATISFLPVISPFRFLVTVILSASTTDRQAERAAGRLFERFPDEGAIADGDVAEIEALIHSAGLSKAKSRNIKALSAFVRENGIPENLDDLVKLPGIGEKTASCYIGTVLGKPAVIADTHFVRVSNRLGFASSTDRHQCYVEIKEKFPPEVWFRLSMVANLHGRTVCKAKPCCEGCFLSSICPSSKVVL